jgi:hypothetical protein
MEGDKDFKTAAQIYAEEMSHPKNNPHKIDTFWEVFNSSKCKTAMLIISILLTAGFVISEVIGNNNPTLHSCFIVIVGYWMGRTSKAIENRRG